MEIEGATGCSSHQEEIISQKTHSGQEKKKGRERQRNNNRPPTRSCIRISSPHLLPTTTRQASLTACLGAIVGCELITADDECVKEAPPSSFRVHTEWRPNMGPCPASCVVMSSDLRQRAEYVPAPHGVGNTTHCQRANKHVADARSARRGAVDQSAMSIEGRANSAEGYQGSPKPEPASVQLARPSGSIQPLPAAKAMAILKPLLHRLNETPRRVCADKDEANTSEWTLAIVLARGTTTLREGVP